MFTVYAEAAFMAYPASAGAAEMANGAVARMLLLSLTVAYYTKSAAQTAGPNFSGMKTSKPL